MISNQMILNIVPNTAYTVCHLGYVILHALTLHEKSSANAPYYHVCIHYLCYGSLDHYDWE